jgi:hypothetical protein
MEGLNGCLVVPFTSARMMQISNNLKAKIRQRVRVGPCIARFGEMSVRWCPTGGRGDERPHAMLSEFQARPFPCISSSEASICRHERPAINTSTVTILRRLWRETTGKALP